MPGGFNSSAIKTYLNKSWGLGSSRSDSVQPRFDILKARRFDSLWNWVRQDALLMYYDIIFGRLTTVDREIIARCIVPAYFNDSEINLYNNSLSKNILNGFMKSVANNLQVSRSTRSR